MDGTLNNLSFSYLRIALILFAGANVQIGGTPVEVSLESERSLYIFVYVISRLDYYNVLFVWLA